MTTAASAQPTARRSRLVPVAVASTVLAAVLTLIGTFEPFHSTSTSTTHDARDWLVLLAFIVVGAVVVFGISARVLSRPGPHDTAAIVFGAMGVLSVAVFWTGLPSLLAGGAVVCAADARSARSAIGLVLAAATLLGAVVLAFTG
ncbi:MAG: hypothetical protein QOE01_2666 [Actinomycetota bacterium]|jgi:hypothetical protein|nr:hypothetical protein [Actinomycetota bacterium]